MSASQSIKDVRRKLLSSLPAEVDGQFNLRTSFYKKTILEYIFADLYLEGAPKEWDIEYFFEHLFLDGYLAITDTPIGVIPLKCGYNGYNVWEHPTTLVFANPVLGGFERTIGVDAAFIFLSYTYEGIWDLLNFYSELLASIDGGVDVACMNAKAAFVYETEDKNVAEEMKKFNEKISRGEPAVFMKKRQDASSSFYQLNPKNSFIGTELYEVKAKYHQELLTKIGLNNVNKEKRERQITDEVNANNEEIETAMNRWLFPIQRGLDDANKLFGLDLHIKSRSQERRKDLYSLEQERRKQDAGNQGNDDSGSGGGMV